MAQDRLKAVNSEAQFLRGSPACNQKQSFTDVIDISSSWYVVNISSSNSHFILMIGDFNAKSSNWLLKVPS